MWTRCEPVDHRSGQAGVAGPFRERQVSCDDQAHLLVALAEESEQVLGPARVHRQVAQFVHDDQIPLADVAFQPHIPISI